MVQFLLHFVLAFSIHHTLSTPLPKRATTSKNAALDIQTLLHLPSPTTLTLNVVRIDDTTALRAPALRKERQNDDCNTMFGMSAPSEPKSHRTETITLYTTVPGEYRTPTSPTHSPLHTKKSREIAHSHHSEASAQKTLPRGPTFTTFPVEFTGLSQLADSSDSVTSKRKHRKTRTITKTTTQTILRTENKPKSRTQNTAASSLSDSRTASKSNGEIPTSSIQPSGSPLPAPTAVPTTALYTAIPLTSTPAWVEPEPSTTTGSFTSIGSSNTAEHSTTKAFSHSYTSIPYVYQNTTSRSRNIASASQSTTAPRYRVSPTSILRSTSEKSSSIASSTTSSRSISTSVSVSSSYPSSSPSTFSSTSLTPTISTTSTQASSTSQGSKTSHSTAASSSSFVGVRIVPVSSKEVMHIATLQITTTVTTLGLTATGTATITVGA